MASKNGNGFKVQQFRAQLQGGGNADELIASAILATADDKQVRQAVRAYHEHAQAWFRAAVPRDYEGRSIDELAQSHVNYQFGYALGQLPVANGTAAVHKRWRAAFPEFYAPDGQPRFAAYRD